MKKTFPLLPLFLFIIILLVGCEKPRPPITTLTAAQEYFLKICREELKYDVTVIPQGRTMWVYVPLRDGIVDFRAAPKNQAPKASMMESWSLSFLEAVFDHPTKTFLVSYDLEKTRKYDQKMTYQNKYADEYSKKQRDILTALTRAYFDVGQVSASLAVENDVVQKMKNNPHSPVSKDPPPEFFVMVFADTKNGVAIKAINYFEDMKMALSNPPAITNEEYGKRYVFEMFGDEKMVGDKTGTNLKIEEVTLPDFLAKQIENRIKYQFMQSGFPPTGETRDEIWNIIAETCRLYQFKDFEKIKLIDLKTQQESIYDKSQL